MGFETPPPIKQEQEELSGKQEDPRLSLEPGQMVFCADLKADDRQFAQVYRTNAGKFAVLTDWPDNNATRPEHLRYNPEHAAAGSPTFDSLGEANKELLRIAELNHLGRAGAGHYEYEGFDKKAGE